MNWVRKHWFLLLCLLLMAFAFYTANRAWAWLSALLLTVYLLTKQVFTPVYWVFAVLLWLLSWLWGGKWAQSLYEAFTGKKPDAGAVDLTGGTAG